MIAKKEKGDQVGGGRLSRKEGGGEGGGGGGVARLAVTWAGANASRKSVGKGLDVSVSWKSGQEFEGDESRNSETKTKEHLESIFRA